MAVPSTTNRPAGRRPGTDDTRSAILRAARDCFARDGFRKTTNKDIAARAGVTSGLIYHYFDSKQDLFAAVTEEVNDLVFGAFEAAAAAESSFADRFRAVLDTASRLHVEDRSLARFSATFAIELQRQPELAAALRPDTIDQANRFFARMAAEAEASGELPPGLAAEDVANMLLATTMGLAHFGTVAPSPAVHRGAIVALQTLLDRALA